MGLWIYLKSQVESVIKTNSKRSISGTTLQGTLETMIDGLGALQLKGVASTTTNPGTPDGACMYLCGGKGTYTNFSGLVVTEDVCFLSWDGTSWTKMGLTFPVS